MALTKITGQVINTATDVTVGVLTVTNTLSVGGTVSVGGTLTYEDVTNVDSVGLITARGGVFVSAGSSIGIGSATPTADIEVHTSSNTLGILSSTSNGANFDLFDNDTQSRIRTVDGRLHLYADFNGGLSGGNVADSAIRFFVDGSNEKLHINSDGDIFTSNDQVRDGARLTVAKNATGFTTAIALHNGSGTGSKIISTRALVLGADYDADSGATSSFISFETDATEKARVASGGQLLIGDTTARGFDGGNTPQLQVASNTSGVWARMSSATYIDSTIGGGIILAHSRNATVGSHTIVQDDDKLGSIFFEGSDGSDFQRGAQIQAYVDGTPGSDDMPGRIEFSTSADGSSSPTLRATFDSKGSFIVGNTNSGIDVASGSAAKLQVKHTTGNISAAFYSTANASGPGGILALGHARDTVSGVLQEDDVMGEIRFAGGDGTDLESIGASIKGVVNLTPGSNDMPGALRFGTTADGAASPTDHWQINRAGILDQLNSGAGIRFLHGHSGVTPNDVEAVLSNTIDDFESGDLDWEIHKDNGLTTGTNAIGAHAKYVKIGPVVHIFGWIRTDGQTSTNNRTAVMTDASGNRAKLPFTPQGTVHIPVNFTRAFQNVSSGHFCLGATHAVDDVYIHQNQSNQYTPASDNCVLTNQTNLVIAFNGSYYTSD